MSQEDFQLFKAWVARVLSMGLPEQHQEKIREIIEENKEVESMVYNLQRIVIESKMQGKAEGKMEGKISTLMRLLSKKFGILPQEISNKISITKDLDIIDKMLDNIFDIQSLEEVEEYLGE